MGRRSKRRNKKMILATLVVVVFTASMFTLNLVKPNLLSGVLSDLYGSTSLEINPAHDDLAVNSNKAIDAKTAFDNIDAENQIKVDNTKKGDNTTSVAGKTPTVANRPESGSTPVLVNGNSAGFLSNQSDRASFVSNENQPVGLKMVNLRSTTKLLASVETTERGTTATSTSSTKQKVGGKPAEPGVTGTLPIGDGTWILLLLGLTYVARKVVKLA